VDERITSRIERGDLLEQAIAYGHGGQWLDALSPLEEAFDEYKKPGNKSTEKSRKLLYLVLTWVLSQIDYFNRDEVWEGGQLWGEMNKDPLFIRFLEHKTETMRSSAVWPLAFSALIQVPML
jgi:hypothetical protein